MIRYALTCEHEHGFEAWFGSSTAYDEQAARGLVECPICASKLIRKQIMAPAVAGTRKREASAPTDAQAQAQTQAMMMEAMGKIRRHVEETFDYVGDTFAKEARAIHEGRSDDRAIYGEATPREVEALHRDGVKVAPLPPAPPKKSDLN
ncbi:MAG: DUF1178 family protein [Caulobacteraceae bacterium]